MKQFFAFLESKVDKNLKPYNVYINKDNNELWKYVFSYELNDEGIEIDDSSVNYKEQFSINPEHYGSKYLVGWYDNSPWKLYKKFDKKEIGKLALDDTILYGEIVYIGPAPKFDENNKNIGVDENKVQIGFLIKYNDEEYFYQKLVSKKLHLQIGEKYNLRFFISPMGGIVSELILSKY